MTTKFTKIEIIVPRHETDAYQGNMSTKTAIKKILSSASEARIRVTENLVGGEK